LKHLVLRVRRALIPGLLKASQVVAERLVLRGIPSWAYARSGSREGRRPHFLNGTRVAVDDELMGQPGLSGGGMLKVVIGDAHGSIRGSMDHGVKAWP